jgi:hypothetical protein
MELKYPKIIVVCGLGRCGSSLTMQMLNAGGIKCNGEYPTFEHDKGSLGGNDPYWLLTQNGKATKILLPHLYEFKAGDYQFIWVDRDPFEQAKSTFKFMHLINNRIGKLNVPLEKDGKQIVGMANNYEHDKKRGIDHLEKYGDVFTIDFENIIMFPQSISTILEAILGQELDTEAMANEVQFRPITCGLDMDLEFRLLKQQGK